MKHSKAIISQNIDVIKGTALQFGKKIQNTNYTRAPSGTSATVGFP